MLAKPTTANPGTPEKVELLIARYSAGLPLFHEQDCREQRRAAYQENSGYSIFDLPDRSTPASPKFRQRGPYEEDNTPELNNDGEGF